MSNRIQLNKSSTSPSSALNQSKNGPGRAHRINSNIVYGAQHPPSLKVIQNLLTNDSKQKSLSNNGASSTSSHQIQSFSPFNTNSHHGANNYKEFVKQTYDDWNLNINDEDIVDDDEFNEKFINISVEDSDEMAKRIIKDHSDKQKLVLQQKRPNNNNSGPGKAQRQQQEEVIQTNEFTTTNTSIKGSQYTTKLFDEKQNEEQLKSTINIVTQINIPTTAISSNQRYQNTSLLDNDNEKFKKILSANPINLEELQNACWKGIPKAHRAICWKLLSDYLPLKVELQEKTIEQKRNSYWELVNEYYSKIYLDAHHDTLRQILNDLPRMNPLMPIFQKKQVQDIFQRILYVWSVRHPASGYVQGINDLVTPFFAVFLTEYIELSKNTELDSLDVTNIDEKQLRQLEADCYGCMTKLLDRIQENYVFSQPGIQKKVQALEELIKRIDERLHKHLKKNHIEFLQFAFRWMNNLLMREIPLQCTIRLWDTYHAEPFGFSDFHLYVCAAFLLRFSKELLKQKDFQDLMLLLQNLPTRSWNSNDIQLLTAEAYKLQVMFANAPKHVTSLNNVQETNKES